MNTELKKLKDLTQNINMVMLSTLAHDGTIHSRPMGTREVDEEGNIWFFTSSASGKVASIDEHPEVNLAYVSPEKGTYVSVVGNAKVVQDKAKEKELWTPMMNAWFPKGIQDPDLVLLKVGVESAEYWDAPQGKMIQFVSMAKAAMTGHPYSPKKGEHGKLEVNKEVH
jgi:general stress protein 26